MNRIPPTWKIKYIEDLHSITIPESSKPYITINKTIELDKGDKVSFSITDRTDEGLTATVTVQGTEPIEPTQSGNDYTFTMPAEDVTISVTYSSTPINYTITADEYSSADKTEASEGETVNVTFVNRDGYNLTSATYNGNPLTITNNNASFTMPAENVTIATTYTKIDYTITADQYSTPNKTTANVGDEITVTFAKRDGYNLTSATYNGTALNITNNAASFTMPAANVTIATTHTKIDYTITADQYSTPNKTTANVGDEITVTFAKRDGYNLTSATYNGTALNISNNTASFTMPAANVTIATTYTKIDYTITADQYSTPNKTTANVGDEITVTFANREGYNLTSATYNGNSLTITNNTASFTMPAANVSIATTYTPIEYNVTAGEYITANKSKATINDQVSFTVADRTADGYQLNKVLINNTEISGTSFNMADYLTDVTITAMYSKIGYTINSDAYSTPNKTTANVGDEITVTFANRDGYNLTSATYNGTALTITNNKASFTMPAENVTIATTYTKIDYTITADQYSTPNKTTANIGDEITVTFANRDGYNLTSATYNGNPLTITNNTASFTMPAANVTIATTYTKVDYTITADQYSTPNKTTANVGDEITVTFANRDGYNLTSAIYNGTPLNITNGAAQFTMPAANVTIATTHTPIEYNITAGEFVTVDKTKATINDQVSFTVADRSKDGYQLEKVLINNTEFTGTSFNIADYLKDVTITAQYSKIGYTITTDDYSSTNKATANVGDVVNVTLKNRTGYNLTSATYNGTPLNITNGAAQFTMPAANVTIATTHTPIKYNITTGEFVTVDKTKATINDQVSFTVADRTNDGFKLDKVLVNNTEFTGTSFNMADYLKDVTITAVYSKNSNPIVEYTITNDEFSTTDKASANEGDVITVTFTNRVGYILTSASYNGTELTITNDAAQFTMPAANVTIATTHTLIEYKITTGEFVTVNKTKATINDQVSFTVEDRTNDGYKLDKVLVNNTDFSGTSFNMADYLKDVTITAVYSKNSNSVVEYSITNDEFSTTDKASANEGDVINVTFTNRDGYNLTSATYNGTPLNITNNAAQFTMPAANVTIATTYKPIKNDKLLIVDDIIVEADGYCAGDVLRLSFKTTCKKGKYQIMFSERAKTEGFVDLDFADIEDSERQTAKFDILSSTNYGNYQGFIRVVDVDGNEGAAFPFGFNIDYPNDIIETKYADLICVNNFSHNYVAYQWMKNGKEIAGANKQFYIDYPALNGVYNVIVTDKNGNKFKVCDFRAAELKTKSAPKPSVNVYPNPALSMQPITIELVGVDISEKCEIMLYTHSGALVQKIADAKTLNVVYLKSGIYTGVVVINGKKLTFKLIVND
ncbi:MAG: hypothetical protein J6Y24_06860 [Bacteroidales bacterium]|nr:hypothetical protein [Bacteroidales bacterium]